MELIIRVKAHFFHSQPPAIFRLVLRMHVEWDNTQSYHLQDILLLDLQVVSVRSASKPVKQTGQQMPSG